MKGGEVGVSYGHLGSKRRFARVPVTGSVLEGKVVHPRPHSAGIN